MCAIWNSPGVFPSIVNKAPSIAAIGEGKLTVVTVDPQIEEQIYQALDPQASAHRPLAAQTSFLRRMLDSLRSFMGEQVSAACPTLICSSPARFHLRRLLEPFLPKLAVLSPSEVPATIEIQSMGVVN